MIIAIVGEVARNASGTGALIASLPLISVLGMIWLWRNTADPARTADHAYATFWFVLRSLPMFLVIPLLLNRGVGCWQSLTVGCVTTVTLYLAMVWVLGRSGIELCGKALSSRNATQNSLRWPERTRSTKAEWPVR